MSLMGTLAKVAIGVVVAKGVGGMVRGAGKAQANTRSAGNGGLFGGANSPRSANRGGGSGLEDLMGSVLGGNSQSGGGLGGILDQLGGGDRSSTRSGGGLNDLIGGLTGGSSAGAGGLGGLLGGLSGGNASARQTADTSGSFSDMLNQSFERKGEPELKPTPQQDAVAGLMLYAIIQAAKSDGVVDENERAKLRDRLKDASPEDLEFVQKALDAPVDIDGLVRQVPRGLEQQVYLMSVMGITLDNQKEAEYLHKLATALRIDQNSVNQIHAQLGVPALYS